MKIVRYFLIAMVFCFAMPVLTVSAQTISGTLKKECGTDSYDIFDGKEGYSSSIYVKFENIGNSKIQVDVDANEDTSLILEIGDSHVMHFWDVEDIRVKCLGGNKDSKLRLNYSFYFSS
jgi:hypothetical protein